MLELKNAAILTYKVENPEGQTNGYQKPDKRFTGTYSGKYGTLAEHYYQGEGRDFSDQTVLHVGSIEAVTSEDGDYQKDGDLPGMLTVPRWLIVGTVHGMMTIYLIVKAWQC